MDVQLCQKARAALRFRARPQLLQGFGEHVLDVFNLTLAGVACQHFEDGGFPNPIRSSNR